VATSEPVVTSFAGAAGVQHTATKRRFGSLRPGWLQVVLDTFAICVALVFASALFGGSARLLQISPVSVIAVATMFITVLAFSGAYDMRVTPINIADTEALVRGTCCALLLFFFGSIASHDLPPKHALLTTVLVVGLLLIQRELGYLLTDAPGRARWKALCITSDVNDRYGCSCHLSRGDSGLGLFLKRGLDLMVAFVLLVLAMPLLVLVAVLIKLDSSGPALIRQQRIGKSGVPFWMWKFRTMRADVCRYAPSPTSDADFRLTRCGRGLRRYSIDELPQLLNVLQGDMSLVGPRPEMPFIVQRYDARERLRLEAVPGLTGLWQISPARALPIHENLQLDLFYIRHCNLFLDLAILLRTITAVLRGVGAT
jgi:lipopolysaccharide/colanic/teichoic acid biosynthesis glycosyltransferase